ncbi:hypothetical protein [Lentzea jiangxiensis]|uniref:Universal stress protein family protein n=1 Tax=Lentzea jiangxiensis TaxID=641025 RepID=A0A1H0X576_9PSEU|nr:hypothetical protein [Lentzea jiangxiensis]SDP97979.1 hypothetical protein SAMN05421507_13510 [Lentzea jiangxiensis]
MTALAHRSALTTATCVLVDVRDCGVTGVHWAAACAEALGIGLVVQATEDDPAHAEVAALLAERPGLPVHVERHECSPPARWEGALVVISRQQALAMPPIAGGDCRDVVVVRGNPAAIAGRFGIVTAVLDSVGSEGVLQRATTLCRARGATRLRVLPHPCPKPGDSLDAAADLVHAACPDVIVELVHVSRSVAEETRLFPSDLLVVSGRERGPGEGLQPAARAALHHAPCPVLFSCS